MERIVSFTDFERGLRPRFEIHPSGVFVNTEGLCSGELADRFLRLHKTQVEVTLSIVVLRFIISVLVLCELREAAESAIPIDLALVISSSTELVLDVFFNFKG